MVTVGTVIVLALYALLDTIISLLINGAMWIAKAIMNSSITLFSENQNIITSFVNLLPFSGGTEGATVNVGSIINGISYGIITLVIVIGVIKSFTAPATGELTDNPLNVVVRAVTAIVAKNLIFGFGTDYLGWSFQGLLGVFGRWFGTILSTIGAFNYEAFTDINTMTLNVAAYIGVLILMASLLGSVLGAAISYIERLLSFALTVLVGPIAISLYAYKETSHVAREWIMSIFTQFGTIFLNLLLWGAFINQLNSCEGLWASSDSLAALIFKLAVAIAILSIIKNCEKIFNSFGLRTLPNAESARALTGGIAALGSGALMAMRYAPMAKGAVERGMHAEKPAMGGSFARGGNAATPFTGNTLYDKNGKLNSKGDGNSFGNAVRGAVARSAGNYNSAVFGSGSARSAQNRQIASQKALSSHMASAAETAQNEGRSSIAGIRIPGAQISDSQSVNKKIANGEQTDAPFYSSSKLANMAISGHEDGAHSGFRFAGSSYSPVGVSVDSPNGEYSKPEVSGDLIAATSSSIGGLPVSGGVGQGVLTAPDGTSKDLGMCFLPTDGGGEGYQLGIGQDVLIDSESGKSMFVTGSVEVGDNGAVVYRLSNPPEVQKVQVTNIGDISMGPEAFESQDSGVSNIFDEIIRTEDFGIENARENDMYDPEDLFAEKGIKK